MNRIDGDARPIGFAKYSAADLANDITVATTTPTYGIVPSAAVDSMTLIVAGSKAYVNFGAAATANTLEFPVGTYNFINCRTAITQLHLLRSDVSTTVNIIWSSIGGR